MLRRPVLAARRRTENVDAENVDTTDELGRRAEAALVARSTERQGVHAVPITERVRHAADRT